MRDLKYIIKKVIIGLLIGIGILMFKNTYTHAATVDNVYINGSSNDLTAYWYRAANNSSTLDFRGVGTESPLDNIYFNAFLCTDATSGALWANANDPNTYVTGTRANMTLNITNVPCSMKGATWKGHIVQLQTVTRTGSDGGGDIRLYLRLSFNQNSSISITNYYFGPTQMALVKNDVDVKAAIQAEVSGKLNSILSISTQSLEAAQQQANWAQQQAQAAQQQLDTMQDDSIEENNPQFNEFNNYLASNGVITNLISLPVTLFTKVLDTIDGTCSNYSLGTLYDSPLVLPCINISDYLGTTLWNTIDILISGLLIYSISRHFVKMFNKMSSLEESDIID